MLQVLLKCIERFLIILYSNMNLVNMATDNFKHDLLIKTTE